MMHRQLELGGRVLDRGDEVEIVLERVASGGRNT